jgi:hypothetical protein
MSHASAEVVTRVVRCEGINARSHSSTNTFKRYEKTHQIHQGRICTLQDHLHGC